MLNLFYTKMSPLCFQFGTDIDSSPSTLYAGYMHLLVRLHPLFESQMFAGLHKAYLIISSLFKHPFMI